MNIEIFEDIILNTVLIVFPILVYLVLVCYKDNISKSYNNLVLSIALITSLYLCLRFGIIGENSKILLFCNIPIVIALMKKKPLLAAFLSLINILYCFFIYKNIYLIVAIKYLAYFILYICAQKRKLSTESFILSVAVLQGFFLSFEYFFKDLDLTLNSFLELIILVFIYYFISFAILYIFKIIEKVRQLNKSIELLEKDKIIKESLFKLTHEIKNPLAVIKGYLDMFDINNKEKSMKYLGIIREEANRSLNIITDFLEFNKIKVVKTEIDLNLLLEDVYDSFKIILNKKNIKLIYNDREDEEIYFEGDYERLKQVLINVLKNSVESIINKGKIEISSNIYKKHIDIIVEDDGMGMNEETLKQIKSMFFTTKQNGSGLGVCLSNEIIKAHNGELIYTSKEGIGTKVTIRLPKE